MGFMGDRSTLLETGRFVRAEAEPGTGAVEAARTVNAQTALTDADFADEAFGEADVASDAELEARHRVAADKGDPGAMSVLGALLLRRGDLAGAEPYLRGATGEGDRAAANNLGVLLHQRGYPEEAAGWWRVAAVAGSAPAAHALGRYYRERGDEPAAEYWLRQAAESGHALGAYGLADLLEHRGTAASSAGSARPPSRGTAKPRTDWRDTCARATPPRPSSGTGRPPRADTAGPPCTWARCWRRAGNSRRPGAGT